MPSESDHIALANRNHNILLHLMPDIERYSDWIATIAFYKAVHVVEAMFAAHLRKHSGSHTNREETLKAAAFKPIGKPYLHLLTASRIARYLEDFRTDRKVSTFAAFMKPHQVKQLVGDRLFNVEQNALFYLTDEARAALVRIDPKGL